MRGRAHDWLLCCSHTARARCKGLRRLVRPWGRRLRGTRARAGANVRPARQGRVRGDFVRDGQQWHAQA